MAYTLGNKCAKNLCKRIVLLQLIIENVVTCFFWNTVYMLLLCYVSLRQYLLLLTIVVCIFTAQRICTAWTMPSQDVCLSICLSHASILSTPLNISSTFFTARWPHHSSFSVPNSMAILQRRSNNAGIKCKGV